MSKVRIDSYLVEQGYFESREKAKRNIMAGLVLINDEKVAKPGDTYRLSDIKEIRLKGNECPYASRAGFKLEKAIKVFKVDMKDKIMLDVGSSTGGFTDCALIFGVKKVFALDVGTNQLIYRLRSDKRVEVYEKTNFRTIEKDFFKEKFDIITMDVSFISTILLMNNVVANLKKDGKFIMLIKPQFEAGREVVRTSKGIIKDEKVFKDVKVSIVKAATEKGLKCLNIIDSPIKGKNGNQEFLAIFKLDN